GMMNMCKMGMRKVTASVLYNGEKYMIITAESPLGKALMGKKAGDEVELKTSKLTRYVVESVS
ncbi:GreA/GreB family elongation factor, partial [uncultured Fretibacterium sp.]|uniref:GreA/GreB family elongation factor n=1 Tax=uncultured Fretibacterium sp. TaxID=1678694 RepID=UPI0026254938